MTGALLVAFVVSAAVSALLTPLVRRFAVQHGALDRPEEAPDRKVHRAPVPLLGGLAPIAAFWLTLGVVRLIQPDALAGLPRATMIGLGLATALLVVGGVLDDRRRLTPGRQFVWPLLAAVVATLAGVGIDFITNPFGGLLRLNQVHATFGATEVVLWADLFTVLWLLGMTYTTKFLDGLDGLVAGVTVIGGVILTAVSLRPEVHQPTTALLAVALAGACLGFLPFNFHPARIFLGESGALWAGFMLGALAVVSGGKIATALLLMGIPILDVAWVIARRLREGRSPFRGADRQHLHFRLLDVGVSHRRAVLTLYALTASFGVLTLVLPGWWKVVALAVLMFVMLGLGVWLVRRSRRVM